MAEDRAYMVTGIDTAGDSHLFASEDRGRAEAMRERMLDSYKDVRANWIEADLATSPHSVN